MHRILRGASFLLVVAFVLPALAADDKKPDDEKKADVKKADPEKKDPEKKADPEKKDPEKKDAPEKKGDADKKGKDDKKGDHDKKSDHDKKEVNSEKSIKAGEITGKILAVDESKRSIKLEIRYKVAKPNEGEINGLAQAKINMAVAQAKRDLNGIVNAQNDIARHSLNLIRYEEQTKAIDFQTIDDVKVRSLNPPQVFDDKGNPKKYTAKELKELRGSGADAKRRDFVAEFSDLHSGVMVSVTLVKKKGAPKPKGKDKEADAEILADYLPTVSQVVILYEIKQ